MRRLFTVAFLACCSIYVYGQNQREVYLLQKEIEKTHDVDKKSELYDQLSKSYYGVNNDSILYYAEKNIALGIEKNNLRAKSIGLAQKGVAYAKMGLWKESLEILYDALRIREAIGDTLLVSATYIDIGNVCYSYGTILENDEEFIRSDSMYVLAMKRYRDSYKLAKKIRDSLQIAKSLKNIGSAHYKLYNYQKAIDYYHSSYRMFPVSLKEKQYGELRMNILSCLVELGDERKALETYESAIVFLKKYRLHEKWASANLTMAVVFRGNGDLERAEQLLREADSVAILANSKMYRALANVRLYEIAKAETNYGSALKYYETYSKLTSQMTGAQAESKIKGLDLKYNAEKKDKEIAIKEKKLTEASQQRRLFIAGITVLMVVLIILSILFVLKYRLVKSERKRELERHSQEINTLLSKSELESIESLLEGREIERKNIARELHDGLGSTLSAVRMYFESASATRNTNDRSKRFEKAYNLLDRAIDDTRGIAHNLVSGTLSKLGLFAALEDLKDTIQEASKAEVHYSFDYTFDRLKADLEINIYRIIQEAFSNSLKHGKPSNLYANLYQSGDKLAVHISDDGEGFEKASVIEGMGLKSIEARVNKLNGNMLLNTQKGKGVSYEIELTIEPDEEDSFS